LDLLGSGNLFQTLSQEQKDLLSGALKLSEAAMQSLSESGFSVKDSVLKARIMSLLSVSLEDVLQMAESFGSDISACSQALLFCAYRSKYEWLNDPECLSLLRSGHPARDVAFSKLAAMALNLDAGEIIAPAPNSNPGALPGANSKEVEGAKAVMTAYSLNLPAVLGFLASVGIDAPEMLNRIEKYQEIIGAFTFSLDELPEKLRNRTLPEGEARSASEGAALRAQADEETSVINKGKIYPKLHSHSMPIPSKASTWAQAHWGSMT
jgi:hypothetical protein